MKVFGIISDHRAFKSKSPDMHNRVLKSCGIDGVYVPLCVRPELIGQAVDGLSALGFAGANVTVPHKQAVMPHLDRLSDEALAIGAVNTIVPTETGLEGHNTDAAGFLAALKDAGLDPAGCRALVLGAGGAAKAVVYALKSAGAERIDAAGRDLAKVAASVGSLGATPTNLPSLACSAVKADLVVNATSVSSPDESPETARLAGRIQLQGCRLVVDLNYGRKQNMWQDLALNHAADFIDGLPMLAHQARRSFTLWTGLEPDVAEFMAALSVP